VSVVLLWKPDWKRGPEFRAPNSGDNRWLSRRLIPFRRVLFFSLCATRPPSAAANLDRLPEAGGFFSSSHA
jgi:hypothetical protein